ncbi:MAG: SDR family oxidoreductase [Cohaesibacter sp.]|nr:SDR family oxidoreductase [Cohaesibacter sp.]
MMHKKTILITGCSTGIGLTCALGLKEKGWTIFATARKETDLQHLRDQGLNALYLDYTDQSSIDALVKTILEQTGGTLDALYNNGAYGQPGAVEDLPTFVLRAQFEANFFGWHELTRQIIPIMRKQGYGRIIQCSSVLGLVALPYRGAYNASKFALEGLSDTLRLELHGTNIHVIQIEPGPITSHFRLNALKKLKDNIDIEQSVHRDQYQQRLARGTEVDPDKADKDTFELPPEAVLSKLEKALDAKNPKAHYYVTVPTYIMGFARRFLPTQWLDAILRANGG